MTKEVYDSISRVFPPEFFQVSWDTEETDPYEYGGIGYSFRRRVFTALPLSLDYEDLQTKLRELIQESERPEACFRIMEEEPHLDFDPISGREFISALIYF